MLKKTTPLVFALALSGAGLAGAPMPEPIAYTLRFPAPQTHYIEVEARVPTDGRPEVELMMAVWTPGSYLVREYARNLEGVTAATETGAGSSRTCRIVRKSDRSASICEPASPPPWRTAAGWNVGMTVLPSTSKRWPRTRLIET